MPLIDLNNLSRFKTNLENTYGTANNPAKLNNSGKVPQAQLPSEVYNIVSSADYESFPQTGEENKIYIDLSTNKQYYWDVAGEKYVLLTTELPSDVFNVLTYATYQDFPANGEDKKIYIDRSTNKQYRWDTTASEYVLLTTEIPADTYNVFTYAQYSDFPLTGEDKRIYIDRSENKQYRWDTETEKYVLLTTEIPSDIHNVFTYAAYEDFPVTGKDKIIYIDRSTNTQYRWDEATEEYVPLSSPDVVKYSAQTLSSAEKEQARTNIGAASAGDMTNLTSRVSDVEDTIDSYSVQDGGFVKEISQTEEGIDIVYSDERETQSIVIESGGLDFDSGRVVEDDNKYYIHLTKDDVDLPLDKFTPFEIPASGGGGSGTTITLSNVVWVRYIRNGKPANFGFTATCSDASLPLTVEWYVNGIKRADRIDVSGASFAFNAGPYLNDSSNNAVRAVITAGDGTSIARNWTVTTNAFAVSWNSSVKPIMLYTANRNVSLGVKVSEEADAESIVTLNMNGHQIDRNVKGNTSITFVVDSSWFNTGTNNITVGMVSATDPTDRADNIKCVAVWAVNAITPIVAFANTVENGTQYEQLSVNYFVYDPDNEVATCSIRVDSEEPRQQQVNRTMQTFPFVSYEEKTSVLTLTCGSASTTTTVIIGPSEYDLGYISKPELVYNVDPVGHSNTDADRNLFGGFIFSQNFDWTNGGFKQDENGNTAFVVKKGNNVVLPRCLFEDSDENGKTIDISYKVTNSDRYDAIAMQELNNGSNKGIILRANNGELRISNIVGQSFRYCEESRIDLSILVEGETDHRVVTAWLDGVPSNVNKYSTAGMLVQNENKLTIGSEYCDVWIYAIRVYNTELNKREMLQNYVSEGNTVQEKVSRYEQNTIIDSKDSISIEDLHKASTGLTIVEIQTTRMTTSKSDAVPAHVIITDGTDVLDLPAATAPDSGDGTVYKVQGTSSAAYGRSAYNLDIDFKGTGKKYKLDSNAIAVNYINIKVNVASSENANNINAVDWYNTYQPYLTESRNRPGVRDTCQGKPCAVFITNTDSVPVWFSSQLVPAGETVLYAMGDICNSKKNKAVFGQDGKVDEYVTHPTKACIEVSGNDTEPERFRSAEAIFNPDADDGKGRWETNGQWDPDKGEYTKIKHFEWRMDPSGSYSDTESDMYQVVTAWDNTVAWLVSTINNPTKFKNEIGNYFAINSLLYHFLFIEYFEGYDNVSKNTFYSYDWDETAQKYLWNIKCAYDMDTILAADNDGIPFGDYGIDYGDTIDGTPSGRSYFNAVTNTIWTNIKAAYQSELSRMYISLRGNGAWNSKAIMDKWNTYQDLRPHAAMVIDAYNKYIKPWKTDNVPVGTETKHNDDSYLPRLQGSKIYWRKQFLTYQTSYMDGKYGYYTKTDAINFRTNTADSSTKDFTIKAYAKTYVTILTDDNRSGVHKIGTGEEYTFENIAVGSNSTMYITPDRLIQFIHPLNETQNSTFGAAGAAKLTDVILGGDDINTSWDAGTSLDVPSVLLKDLSIRNMVNFSDSLNLSNNVELETLDTRGTNAGSITLPALSPLRTVQLNACTSIKAQNLNKVQTFTMENGDNIVSLLIENCNATINNAIQTYITQASASTSAATKRMRIVMQPGLDEYDQPIPNWQFSNLDILVKLASTWKGYNSLGEEQEKPVLAGLVHVTILSKKKLEIINNVWGAGSVDDHLDEDAHQWSYGDLTITYDSLIPSFTVSFFNVDGSTIKDKQGHDYVQYVDLNNSAYDPIEAGEIDTPTYVDPAGQYTYTFKEWIGLEGAVIADKRVDADYTTEIITYTVRWWDRQNGVKYDERLNVAYGAEAIYDPEGTIGFPTLNDEEPAGVYKVFNGWDKSTGFITHDIDVYATWIRGSIPLTSKNLKDMNIAEIYGIAKARRASEFFDYGDYTDIRVGRDFNFSNVTSALLMQNRYFNGEEIYKLDGKNGKPLVKLFDVDSPSFTLAVDYEFTRARTQDTLIACCDAVTGAEGFRVYYDINVGEQNIKVAWGDRSDIIGHGLNKGIIVIRHTKGSKNLMIASDNNGKWTQHIDDSSYGGDKTPDGSWDVYRYDTYNASIHWTEIPRAQETQTDAVLSFGAMPFGTDGYRIDTDAKGWIHWCKIWYDDLGAHNVQELAAWSHETWRMQYRGNNIYNIADGTGLRDGASFVAVAPLSQYLNMYNYKEGSTSECDTTGGWARSVVRSFISTRCFNALPYAWQAIISPVSIRTKGGKDNPTQLESTVDKLYIPALADMFNITSGLIASEGKQIPWMIDQKDRVKFMNSNFDETNQVYVVPDDPTLYTSYNVKENDIWIISDGTNVDKAYIYLSQDSATKHAYYGGRPTDDSSNNVVATGAQGGLWVRSNPYWLRTNSDDYNHYTVTNSGGQRAIWIRYMYYQNRSILLMFSI